MRSGVTTHDAHDARDAHARRRGITLPHDAFLHRLLEELAAAGVHLDGPRPSDPVLHDARTLRRVAWRGLDGLADAYVDGWWDCEALDDMLTRALTAGVEQRLRWAWPNVADAAAQWFFNEQSLIRASANVAHHYDLGNDLFGAMLDARMVYSCAYWKDATTLDAAQEAKLDLVCRKMGLCPGMRVLDIGCGWGSFVQFAAERYRVECVGVTLSKEQAALARTRCRDLPVTIAVRDYRAVEGRFDRVVSIGMFEHVGPRNYRAFFETAARVLADDGLMLLHAFGSPVSSPTLRQPEVVWVRRNIFPGIVLPSLAQIGRALDGLLVVRDVQDFGTHYDPTLMAWYRNFAEAWPALQPKYGERFGRLWTYYLNICAAAFRAGKYPVWQFVLAHPSTWGRYTPVR